MNIQEIMQYNYNPDQLAKLNIKITLGVGFVLFSLAIVLITLYNFFPKMRDTLRFTVTALATSAAATSTVYALRNIQQNAVFEASNRQQLLKSKVTDRTLTYISRWNDTTFVTARKKATKLLVEINSKPEDEQLDFIRNELKKEDLKQEVVGVLNFLEEMACCINRGIIDEELLTEFYKGIVLIYKKKLGAWIVDRRNTKNNPKLFVHFENLAKKWEP